MTSAQSVPQLVCYSLKRRLYSIVVFLGLLPVVGAGISLVAVSVFQRDGATLDSIFRGTIHLERVNSLIYAVVMESRGIYMSPDWKTAAPFAENLMRQLDELRAVAAIWRADESAAQQADIGDLAARIDQFVRFRTELVRRAKEESTAAARVYGDNDANRSVRTALNQSLDVVGQSYQQAINQARRSVESDDRMFLAILLALAGVSILAFSGGLVFLRIELLAPVLRIRDTMLSLAEGHLDIAMDGAERAREIGDMARAVQVFHATFRERQRSSRETRLLSELNEWLQSCNSLTELFEMVAEFLGRLLPGCAGSLYIYANSRDILEGATGWNGGRLIAAMHPDDCWGLRRGRPYTLGDNEIDFLCGHVNPTISHQYCCIPILAHGETIGLLHLEFGGERQSGGSGAQTESIAAERRLGLVCAEQISLAIANVKLRDQLRDQSIRDPLTGLFNRRYLLETCRREFSRARRAAQSVSLLSLDIDHFKKFNDNHGHDAGDTALRAVAGCLDKLFRNDDVACRFGGEEFVVLLPGADIVVAARRAEELRGNIEALVVPYLEENLPRITVSIGVAAFPEAGDMPQEILKAADEALYRAKEDGRNRVELFAAAPSVPPPAARAMPRALAAGFYIGAAEGDASTAASVAGGR
jgi:diguanylate cyclase (GGDEF)-like protein